MPHFCINTIVVILWLLHSGCFGTQLLSYDSMKFNGYFLNHSDLGLSENETRGNSRTREFYTFVSGTRSGGSITFFV